MLFRSFSAALNADVNPDNIKASVRLYSLHVVSDGRIIIEFSMNALWSDDAILAFTFYSRVLFVLSMAEKTVLSRDDCRLTQWAWLKVWRVDTLNANLRIFIIDVIDDVDELLQPYFETKNAFLGDLGMLKN